MKSYRPRNAATELERVFPDRIRVSVFGVAIFALAVIGYLWTVWPKDLWWLIDAEVYRAGAERVTASLPLYDHSVYDGLQFTYSPFAALCFVPLTFFSMDSLRFLVTCVNLAAPLVVAWMAWGFLGYRPNHGRLAMTFLVGGFALWLEPVQTTVVLGQVNLLLLILIMMDCAPHGSYRMRGAGVGIAAAIKLTPCIFVFYFVVTRQFKAALVSVLTILSTIAIGFFVIPRDSAEYWGGVFLNSHRIGAATNVGNQSIAGLLSRQMHVPNPPTLLWVTLSGLTVIIALTFAALAHWCGEELLAISVVGIAGCLASPLSWSHHWVWAILLLVIGVHHVHGHRPWAAFSVAAFVMLFFSWIVGKSKLPDRTPPMGIIQRTSQAEWSTLVCNNLYVWIAVIVYAATFWYLSRIAAKGFQSDPPVGNRNGECLAQ
ncbi:glycosyltransferase 87 family protein [Streptomyces sp. IMTB 2501]|uniref:glycosyltransferase 87 family protein n=1 Tax=Streptomyces sp. IMTB 2501 TaxID=1776340 RepID=UPI0009A24CB7|nr:glycosyltransferase 87 family protein [Streptomyces sp. IMTB 2501]